MKQCPVIALRRDASWLPFVGLAAVLFGILTLISSSRVLFFSTPGAAGVVVPFVVWFNFGAAFLYIAAGVALVRRCGSGLVLALLLALTTAAVAVALALYALLGGAFALKTAGALMLRTVFWLAVSLAAFDRRAARAARSV